MNIEIKENFIKLIHGFGGDVEQRDYTGTAFQLSDKTWRIVKEKGLKNKGINIWVYEFHEKLFAGVELEPPVTPDTGLEEKNIVLSKYAYYKHTGPYKLIKQTGARMTAELKQRGIKTVLPYIEIYGHWTGNEATSETELLMTIA